MRKMYEALPWGSDLLWVLKKAENFKFINGTHNALFPRDNVSRIVNKLYWPRFWLLQCMGYLSILHSQVEVLTLSLLTYQHCPPGVTWHLLSWNWNSSEYPKVWPANTSFWQSEAVGGLLGHSIPSIWETEECLSLRMETQLTGSSRRFSFSSGATYTLLLLLTDPYQHFCNYIVFNHIDSRN